MIRSAIAHRLKFIRPQPMQRLFVQGRFSSNVSDALKSTRAFPEDLTPDALPEIAQTPIIEFGANTPVGWIENALEFLHTTGGMSWGLSIIVGTMILRGLLLPIALKGQIEASKMQAVKPLLTPIQERLQKAKKIGDQVAAQAETQKMIKIFREHKINPLKGFLGLIQIPFFISFFIAVSKMGHAGIPGFEVGGYGWLSNLSAPDPTYITPVAIPFMVYWSMVVNEKANPGGMPPIMKNVMIGAMILGLYFTISLPSAIYYYLIPSIVLTGLQTILFNNANFRKYVGLPILEKQVPPTHDVPHLKAVAAVRPMKMSEAFKEAKEAMATLKKKN